MACRRAALALTNTGAPPTRYQITDLPPPTPPPRRVPWPVPVTTSVVLGALLAASGYALLLAGPILAASLQGRLVHPQDSGRHAAWLQAGTALGGVLASFLAVGAAR